MNNENVDKLYQKVLKYSGNNRINNYLDFLFICGSHYSSSKEELELLINQVLKRILNNIKDNTTIDEVLSIKIKTKYKSEIAYKITIKLLKEYYKNDYNLKEKNYFILKILDKILINNINKKDTSLVPNIYHYILNYLFKIHFKLINNK